MTLARRAARSCALSLGLLAACGCGEDNEKWAKQEKSPDTSKLQKGDSFKTPLPTSTGPAAAPKTNLPR